MTPRLKEIASHVQSGASLVDVGSDHAYIPIFLVGNGRAERALCTDINDGPLKHSRENISQYGLSHKIKTQKANGLSGVDLNDYDTVIIAGMGGMLIWDILKQADSPGDKRFILQPMTAIAELREALLGNGFTIEHEHFVPEGEKVYVVMEVIWKRDFPYSPLELLVGRNTKGSPNFALWKTQIQAKLEKRILGLKRAKNRNAEEIARLEQLLKELCKNDN